MCSLAICNAAGNAAIRSTHNRFHNRRLSRLVGSSSLCDRAQLGGGPARAGSTAANEANRSNPNRQAIRAFSASFSLRARPRVRRPGPGSPELLQPRRPATVPPASVAGLVRHSRLGQSGTNPPIPAKKVYA